MIIEGRMRSAESDNMSDKGMRASKLMREHSSFAETYTSLECCMSADTASA